MESTTTLSVSELAQIRNNLQQLLDELQLDAFLFEIEPKDKQWELTVECATEDGWETIKYSAKQEYLIRGADDLIIHDVLIDGLKDALSACSLKK